MMFAIFRDLLVLFVIFFGASHYSLASSVDETLIKGTIEKSLSILHEKNNDMHLFDFALSRLSGYKGLSQAYTFFVEEAARNLSNSCLVEPKEAVFSFHIPINLDDSKNVTETIDKLLNMPLVRGLPKSVKDKVDMLRFVVGNSSFVDTVAVIEMNSDKDHFEVGHVIVKIIRRENKANILLFAPMVTVTLPQGCHFQQEFREVFIGLSQDIQTWVAIKAAENPTLADQLNKFIELAGEFKEEVNIGKKHDTLIHQPSATPESCGGNAEAGYSVSNVTKESTLKQCLQQWVLVREEASMDLNSECNNANKVSLSQLIADNRHNADNENASAVDQVHVNLKITFNKDSCNIELN